MGFTFISQIAQYVILEYGGFDYTNCLFIPKIKTMLSN